MGQVTFSWRDSSELPEAGTFVTLLNRRGEGLGTGRVLSHRPPERPNETRPGLVFYSEEIVEVEVPSHLIWEARGIRRPKAHASAIDVDFLRQNAHDLRRIPAWMAKLETVPPLSRQHPKKGRQAIRIGPKIRR
mgnify:CR=1 FL=1